MNTFKVAMRWLANRLAGKLGTRRRRREVIRRPLEIQLEFPWLSKR